MLLPFALGMTADNPKRFQETFYGSRQHKHLKGQERYEWQVWLAFPGISLKFHAHTLGVSRRAVAYNRSKLAPFSELRSGVHNVWKRATRKNVTRLCRMRGPDTRIPLICQIFILDDVKKQIPKPQIMLDYDIAYHQIYSLKTNGPNFYDQKVLVEGFAQMVGKYKE